ncbi:uncharacterized protein LOC124645753 [Helicoverpa zea]|uniref:uncharacterized protein LOC124645753 n=1 Tax=Helicoverpa zea TaxID=7113 RepID=UPI001F563518|nr:uncharacterized protein LOC124645753 [Helicoverpa zea]
MASSVVLLCVSWFALAAAGTAPPYNLADAEHHFENFIQKHGKTYASEHEKQASFQVFKQNLHKINKMNAESDHAVFGITQFADLTDEEFHIRHGCLASSEQYDDEPCKIITDEDIDYNDAPESFDWRDQNVVTPAKNQRGCGSCYAFSTTGNIEGQYAIKYKQLLSLSEQQIVDCDDKNSGCGGGAMAVAFRSLIDVGGSELEGDYPYVGYEADCEFDVSKVKVKLSDCRSYQLKSQEKVKQLLYHTGPISIAIQGGGVQHYDGGIISDKRCNRGPIDHGVLLVGYGSENGSDYWIVKNSWGEGYGEGGYFRMQRGEGHLSCSMMKNEFMASSIVAVYQSIFAKYTTIVAVVMTSTVVLLCVSWFALAAAGTAPPYNLADAEHHFDTFIETHGKVYPNEEEKQYRFQVFKDNLHKYNKMNAESNHAVFGITQFSDLTSEDFHARHTCFNPELRSGHNCDVITDNDIDYNDAPESFDWRDQNAVTPVKDQGGCGSCYAFSSIANVESMHAIKRKELIDLSVQQVVDCSKENHGCLGGKMSKVFGYLMDVGGSEPFEDYPYIGQQGDCQFEQEKVKIKLSNCHVYNLSSQEKVKQLLYHNGPIVIGINGEGVQHYHGGIISDEHCNVGQLSHGVLLVGYGSENGSDYWIVKNSWGDGYGEKGYFRMERREGGFACGMMNPDMTSSVVAD